MSETAVMKNYTVQVELEVRAGDEERAIGQVAEALKRGYEGSGIAPVATFNARPGAPRLLDKANDS